MLANEFTKQLPGRQALSGCQDHQLGRLLAV